MNFAHEVKNKVEGVTMKKADRKQLAGSPAESSHNNFNGMRITLVMLFLVMFFVSISLSQRNVHRVRADVVTSHAQGQKALSSSLWQPADDTSVLPTAEQGTLPPSYAIKQLNQSA